MSNHQSILVTKKSIFTKTRTVVNDDNESGPVVRSGLTNVWDPRSVQPRPNSKIELASDASSQTHYQFRPRLVASEFGGGKITVVTVTTVTFCLVIIVQMLIN